MTGVANSATEASREIIAHHSKSFALASRLLPPSVRDCAVIVYAWCRRADDAVDQTDDAAAAQRAVERLARELDHAFAGRPSGDSIADAFGEVAAATGMPQDYPTELLAGMAMDAFGHHYEAWPDLLLYCYRVAGTVGLMMSHVMGLGDAAALRNAAHMGMAMQLTNISRDVREDWDRGRIYIPDTLLEACGAGDLREALGRPLPIAAKRPLAKATGELLASADQFYTSGDRGMAALAGRCRWAVAAARSVYSAIGARVRAQGCDPFAPRAVVSKARKLALVSRAGLGLGSAMAQAWRAPVALAPLSFPDDVLTNGVGP